MSNLFAFNDTAAKQEGGSGGSKVLETGVYDVTILTASKTIAGTGTIGVDWSFQVEGSKYPNIIYGSWMFKADGTPIAMNYNPLQGLMGLNKIASLTEFQKEIEVKGGTKMVTAFKELDGLKTKVAVVKVFDAYNGEVREKNEVRGWLDATTGQSFTEKTAGKDAKQIAYYNKMQDVETEQYKKHIAEADDVEEDTSDDSSLL